jgi:hypothetical protein
VVPLRLTHRRAVPADPKQCRMYALECAELARTAKLPQAKELFLNLAQSWLNLALELERTTALLDEEEPPRRVAP